jgi:SlyX protein
MDATEELTRRVTDLELRFMKLERFADDLSGVVAEQQKTIDLLMAQVRRLTERSAGADDDPKGERPPHY